YSEAHRLFAMHYAVLLTFLIPFLIAFVGLSVDLMCSCVCPASLTGARPLAWGQWFVDGAGTWAPAVTASGPAPRACLLRQSEASGVCGRQLVDFVGKSAVSNGFDRLPKTDGRVRLAFGRRWNGRERLQLTPERRWNGRERLQLTPERRRNGRERRPNGRERHWN